MTLSLAALVVLTCAFLAWLFFRSSASVGAKLLTFPLLLVLGLGLYAHYLAELGAPIKGLPTVKFVYVHHVVTNRGKTIVLWAYVNGGDRLFSFPYTRKDEKALERAQHATQRGHPQTGKPAHGKKAGAAGSPDFTFESGERLRGHDIPKEGN